MTPSHPTHTPTLVVYGAYGHTGRFIVAELMRRGLRPILAGRDRDKLDALSALHGGLDVRVAAVDDAHALDRSLQGAAAVIHAAGPFALTAGPLVEAAQRAQADYFDVAAEPDVVESQIDRYAAPSASAGIVYAPTMGFYGALGHLAAAAAMDDWAEADTITLASALSSWLPTEGTRASIRAGEARRGGRRPRFESGKIQLTADAPPLGAWDFPAPLGRQTVMAEFATSDAVTLSRRFKVNSIEQFMTLAPLKDLGKPGRPEPVDARGRSAQTFLIEALARRGSQTRRAVLQGQDIYAVTAPLVVEAALQVTGQRGRWRGLVTASDLGLARDFLHRLGSENVRLD